MREQLCLPSHGHPPFKCGKQPRASWKSDLNNFPVSSHPPDYPSNSPSGFNYLGNQTSRFIASSSDSYLLSVSELAGFLSLSTLEWWVQPSFALCIHTPPLQLLPSLELFFLAGTSATFSCTVLAWLYTLAYIQEGEATFTVNWKRACLFGAHNQWCCNIMVNAFLPFLLTEHIIYPLSPLYSRKGSLYLQMEGTLIP